MDAGRFDDVIRSLIASPSRRTVLGLSLGGVLSPLLGLAESLAKKKKGKKKKKKCKGGAKKCGKTCIPATSCCTDANCGAGGATCQSGTCLCPAGEKDCQGTCVPDDVCCPSCTGDQTCQGGACACPGGTFPCGTSCVDGDECCSDLDCTGNLECANGFCVCNVPCDGGVCCNSVEDEICEAGEGCQGGGCPTTDYCNSLDTFVCGIGCICTTTVDPTPGNACIINPLASLPDCTPCSSSAECGAGEACIHGGGSCSCAVEGTFCTPLCEEGALRAARRGGSPPLKDASTAQGAARKRRGHKRGGRKHRR